VSVATTVAPEITAPDLSVTTPEMLPVMLADANVNAKSMNASTATIADRRIRIADLLREAFARFNTQPWTFIQ
jgi:hypothetical protein